MTAPTTDVDTIVTHDEFDEFLGRQLSQGSNLLPKGWNGSSKPARAWAYKEVLKALERRTPPVREADIITKSELKEAILYGAAHHVYALAITQGGETPVFAVQMKHYGTKFGAEVTALRPTVTDGVRAHAHSIGITRR